MPIVTTIAQRDYIRRWWNISAPRINLGDPISTDIWGSSPTANRYHVEVRRLADPLSISPTIKGPYSGHRPTLDPLPLPE